MKLSGNQLSSLLFTNIWLSSEKLLDHDRKARDHVSQLCYIIDNISQSNKM